MDSLFGFIGTDYVIIAADTQMSRSIIKMKNNEEKILELDNYKLLALSGPAGDRSSFGEFIKRNIVLYEMRQNISLSTQASAHFTRGELADALRSNPYQVNMLLGGYDKQEGPSLYFIDYLASLKKVDYGCQGYAGYFLLGLMDKYYKKGMNLEEGLNLVERCIEQLKLRFVLDNQKWMIKISDKNGINELKISQSAISLQEEQK